MPPTPVTSPTRRFVILTASVLAVACAAFPASAAKPPQDIHQPLAWTVQMLSVAGVVEQQSPGWDDETPELWVHNTMSCLWDVDDFGQWAAGGYLQAGQSVSLSVCKISDWGAGYAPYACLDVTASSVQLSVTMIFAPGLSYVALPVAGVGNETHYSLFTPGPWYAPSDPALQSIPGSNGGIGVPTDATVTIANAGTRKVNGILAGLKLGLLCYRSVR